MSRPQNLPPDAALIAQRWHEAKAKNPRLTQAEFVRRAVPSYVVSPIVTKGSHKGKAKTAAQIADSRARYLRLVLEGKRSGTSLVRKSNYSAPGTVANAYNARIYLGDDIGWKSVNVISPGNRSTLDVFRVQSNPNFSKLLAGEMRAFMSRYHRDKGDREFELLQYQAGDDAPSIGAVEVRKVKTYQASPRYIRGSE